MIKKNKLWPDNVIILVKGAELRGKKYTFKYTITEIARNHKLKNVKTMTKSQAWLYEYVVRRYGKLENWFSLGRDEMFARIHSFIIDTAILIKEIPGEKDSNVFISDDSIFKWVDDLPSYNAKPSSVSDLLYFYKISEMFVGKSVAIEDCM